GTVRTLWTLNFHTSVRAAMSEATNTMPRGRKVGVATLHLSCSILGRLMLLVRRNLSKHAPCRSPPLRDYTHGIDETPCCTRTKAASTSAPTRMTVAMITAAIAATIIPYSTAVAPSSFLAKNFLAAVASLVMDITPGKVLGAKTS